MNIRFKMPRLWRKPHWDDMFKDLSLTFIGTTLSIVLTFGTAQYLEHRQLREDGRQTAMMVIHDMEGTAEYFQSLAETEAKRYNITQYVLQHIDRLSSFSADTLSNVYSYVISTKTHAHHYDDSNEKLFLSSQDVWKNIDNPTFIDVSQDFFHERRKMFENVNEWDLYIPPISHQESVDYSLEHHDTGFDYADFLSERLKRPEVEIFVKSSSQRQRDLVYKVEQIRYYAKRCKFIMDISDDELRAYLDKRKHGGKPLQRNRLIGRWIYSDTMEGRYVLDFQSNDTLISTNITHVANERYMGRIDIIYHSIGTWEIKGDTLVMNVIGLRDYAIDTTHIHCLPDKQKEVSETIAKWDSACAQYMKQEHEQIRDCWAAFSDSRGQRMEIWRIDPESGEEECFYMTRDND